MISGRERRFLNFPKFPPSGREKRFFRKFFISFPRISRPSSFSLSFSSPSSLISRLRLCVFLFATEFKKKETREQSVILNLIYDGQEKETCEIQKVDTNKYRFGKWYTQKDIHSGTVGMSDKTDPKKKRLPRYALWTRNTTSLTIRFCRVCNDMNLLTREIRRGSFWMWLGRIWVLS